MTVTSDAWTKSPTPDVSTRESAFQQSQATPHAGDINATATCIARYAYTQLLGVLFANELQSQCLVHAAKESRSIISLAVDGGTPATGTLCRLFSSGSLDHAAGALFACTAGPVREQEELYRGTYLGVGGKLMKGFQVNEHQEMATRLWRVTEEVIADIWRE